MKQSRQNVGRKKSTGYILLSGPQLREAEGHMNLSSCLHVTIIHPAPIIVKYINKNELYKQCAPRRVKDTNER